MKIFISCLVSLLFFLNGNAQIKAPKTTIVGKWHIASVKVAGIYYDVIRDAIAPAGTNKRGFNVYKNYVYIFNPDGSYEISITQDSKKGIPADAGTYTISQDRKSIFIINKDPKIEKITGHLKKGHLIFSIAGVSNKYSAVYELEKIKN